MYSYGPPHMAVQKQDNQHENTFSSHVRIRDVVLKTCLGQWMIGRSGERGSGISVLPARHDDDDDDIFLTSFDIKSFSGEKVILECLWKKFLWSKRSDKNLRNMSICWLKNILHMYIIIIKIYHSMYFKPVKYNALYTKRQRNISTFQQ